MSKLRSITSLVLFALSVLSTTATVYNVGPDQPYPTPNNVPWESLEAGDHVRIHHRPEPYHNKWVICRQGTEDEPIVIEGIPGPNGELPIIDGKNATTRAQLDFWSEQRALIKIGGASRPADTTPKHIWIKHLEIRNSRPPFTYTGKRKAGVYQKQAAGIYIEKGEHIRISHCHIHNNGNGIMTSWFSKHLTVEHCHIHANGVEKSGLEHNCYIDGIGALFQYNHFGKLRPQTGGVNFKSRAAATVLRYNWIEGGKRCVNIPESPQQFVFDAPDYHDTYIYGNVLIRDDKAWSNQILHYGGELGNEKWYRKGTLHFYNNTVIANRTRSTTLFVLSTGKELVDCRNNIIYRPEGSGNFGLLAQGGKLKLHNNWISQTVRENFMRPYEVIERSGNIRGTRPGFINFAQHNLALAPNSECINAGATINFKHPVMHEYSLHQDYEARRNTKDIGAFAFKGNEVTP